MTKSMKQATIIIFSLGATVAIWAAGWILYDQLELWQTIANTSYQNMLLAIIGAEIAVSAVAAAKTKQPLTSLDKKQLNQIFQRSNKKIIPKIEQHETDIQLLKQRLSDIRAAMKMAPTTKEATK